MKKLIVFVVSLVLMMSLCVPAFADESAPTAPAFPAGLVIESVSGNGSVSAGRSFTVYFSIDTADEYFGGTAVASISGSGFTVDGFRASYNIGTVTKGSNYAVPVFCAADTATGRYPVTLTVDYTEGGKTVTLTQVLNINVTGYTEPTIPESDGSVSLDITSAPNYTVAAGDTFDVTFSAYLNNVYTNGIFGYAYSYGRGTVSVSGTGFTLAGALAEQNISSGSNTVTVLVDKSVETGRYSVVLTVTFDVNGESFTASRTLNIDVENDTEEIIEPSGSKFRLTAAAIPESKGKANLSTTLKISLKNDSDSVARDVKITLSNLGDIILDTYTDVLEAGDLNAGQTVNASFPIKFPEVITAPQTTLVATATYLVDGAAEPVTENFNVYLQQRVTKEEEQAPEEATLIPKVIVSQYTTDVEKVASGEQFTLTFTLKNTSSAKDLYNMAVNVEPQGFTSGTTSSGPVFTFIDGTSSFYTDVLEKNGELEYSIRLKCSASAGAGSYPIKISYNYQYMDKGAYSSPMGDDMDLNIPVEEPIKFDLLEWTPPTECPLDGTVISFQYYNKSRNPMTSLSIGMEGDFEMPTQYVGTLNASMADYFNGTITPKADAQVGDVLTAVLVFTFEDAAGEEKRKEETFEVTVTEAAGGMGGMGGDMGDFGDFGDFGVMDPSIEYDENGMPISGDSVEESGGLPLWAKIAIPSAAAVLLIVIIVVVVKKVKAKKASEDDDDDE